jgi:hypothetical protein
MTTAMSTRPIYYIHSSLSFSFLLIHVLSIAGLNADGTLTSLDSSMADDETLADSSPYFASTGQDES